MIKITDFDKNKIMEQHCWDAFGQCEIEMLMRWILLQNIENRNFKPVKTEYNHDHLIRQGLLEKHGEQKYTLTLKTLGILYSVYHKDKKTIFNFIRLCLRKIHPRKKTL